MSLLPYSTQQVKSFLTQHYNFVYSAIVTMRLLNLITGITLEFSTTVELVLTISRKKSLRFFFWHFLFVPTAAFNNNMAEATARFSSHL